MSSADNTGLGLFDDMASAAGSFPTALKESFEAYWSAFVQQIRAARNDAGHPSSVQSVGPETVHASLLIFPEMLRLAAALREWVHNDLT